MGQGRGSKLSRATGFTGSTTEPPPADVDSRMTSQSFGSADDPADCTLPEVLPRPRHSAVSSASSSHTYPAMLGAPSNNSRSSFSEPLVSQQSTYVHRHSTRKLSCQAAGHIGNMLRHDDDDEETPEEGTILKKLDEAELAAYERIYRFENDSIHAFVADFYGEAHMDPTASKALLPQRFIRLSNLLKGFDEAVIMDVKIGIRSFQESELLNDKARPDLFKSMQELSPEEATGEERLAESITKHRYMTFRDKLSSTLSLGFRVDGIVGPGMRLKPLDFAKVHEHSEIVHMLLGFLPPPRWRSGEEWKREAVALSGAKKVPLPCSETELSELATQVLLASIVHSRLEDLLKACEESAFFRCHEFVGSSVLIAMQADPPKADVFLIDFAKNEPVPDGITVNHRSPWRLGNHEDGMLFGLANCISCWKEVISELETEITRRQSDSV